MKALVTGATGLIGSGIVREPLKDGVEVRVTIREKSDTRNIDSLDIEKVKGDIRDADSMMEALVGVDVFYQTAALYTTGSPEKQYYDINIEGTKTALNAALKQGVTKVVYTSSIAAISCTGTDVPADEQTEWKWEHLGLPYITTKYQGEKAALEFCNRGLPLVVVNPTMVIGEKDIKPTPSGQIILNLLNRKYAGYPDGGANFVDVEDIAREHILAAQKGRNGERYILGNTNISYKDLFKLVGEIAGVPVPARRMPASVMIAYGYVCQLVSAISGKPLVIDAKTARYSCQNCFYDCSKAINELGLPQKSLRTTLEKTVKWFRENGYVTSKNESIHH